MRSREEYERVKALVAEGLNDSEVAMATGISRTTVREWRNQGHPSGRRLTAGGPCDGSCGSAEHASAFGAVYAYLLGQYLGDGTLSQYPRHVYRLRIACTAAYPRIIEEVSGATMTIRGSERVALLDRIGDVEVSSYWKHWICIFPQHGPGPKWKRPIRLVPWQQEVIEMHPRSLLRGLVHSDGCRHINTVKRPVAGRIKRYHYTRYVFTNASEDIRRLFEDTCDALDIHWTRTSERAIAVSRRADVARLDDFIGPKT